MKKLTLIIAAILFCGSVFTSCKKDPSGNSGSNSKKLVEVRVNQTLSLASSSNDALNRAYDVKVIYFDAGNQIATHNFTPSELGWIGECVHTSFPCKAGFRLYATPKSDLSGVSEDEKFDIQGTFKFTIVGKYSDGSTTNLELKQEGIAYTGLRPYNGRVIKSLRFAYQIDQNGKKEAIEIEE
jgi:hypothetical protein